MRITNKNIAPMFARTVRAAQSVGIDTTDWYVRNGSPTSGITYKLANFGYEGAVHDLGISAREAYTALYNLAVAWEGMSHLPRTSA